MSGLKNKYNPLLSVNIQKVPLDNIIDVTYDQLMNLINNNLLNIGSYYKITDYQTKHIIAETSPAVINTGAIEELLVQALDVNLLSTQAYSMSNTDDIMTYDVNANAIADESNFIGAYQEDGAITNDGANMFNILTNSFDLDFKPYLDPDGNGWLYVEWDTHWIYIEKDWYESDTESWHQETTLNNRYTLTDIGGGNWRVTFLDAGVDLLDPTYNYGEAYSYTVLANRTGYIKYRKNLTNNFGVKGDFRELKVRLYKPLVSGWTNTSYSKHSVVKYSNMFYISMIDNNTATPNSYSSYWLAIGSLNDYVFTSESVSLPNDIKIPINANDYKDRYIFGGNIFNLNLFVNSQVNTFRDTVAEDNTYYMELRNSNIYDCLHSSFTRILNNCTINGASSCMTTNDNYKNDFYNLSNNIIGKFNNCVLKDSYQIAHRYSDVLSNTVIERTNKSLLNIAGTDNFISTRSTFAQNKYLYISATLNNNKFEGKIENLDLGTTYNSVYYQNEIMNNVINKDFLNVKIIGGGNETASTYIRFMGNSFLEYVNYLYVRCTEFENNFATTRIQGTSGTPVLFKSNIFSNNKFLATFNEVINIQIDNSEFKFNEFYDDVYGTSPLYGNFNNNIIKGIFSNNAIAITAPIDNNKFNIFQNNTLNGSVSNNEVRDFTYNILNGGSIRNNKGNDYLSNNDIYGTISDNKFVVGITNLTILNSGALMQSEFIAFSGTIDTIYVRYAKFGRFTNSTFKGTGVANYISLTGEITGNTIEINNEMKNVDLAGDFINNNLVLNDFKNCSSISTIEDSTFTGDFINNVIKSDVSNIDFTTATHVKATYPCELLKNFAGVSILKYLDSLNNIVYTNLND